MARPRSRLSDRPVEPGRLGQATVAAHGALAICDAMRIGGLGLGRSSAAFGGALKI
jgi:hypothetical protein